MVLNLILGRNISTQQLIKKLNETSAENVTVLDYDLEKGYEVKKNTKYLSVEYALEYVKSFEEVYYHSSIYIYPTI